MINCSQALYIYQIIYKNSTYSPRHQPLSVDYDLYPEFNLTYSTLKSEK